MRELFWAAQQTDQIHAVALYLHGGAVRSTKPVRRVSPTFQRTRVMSNVLAPALAAEGLATAVLKYEVRGWNAKVGEPSPLADARWALDEIQRVQDKPVVIIGHSMGGRTGLHVADHPSVVGLVALAPWFPADEDVAALQGRHLAVIHGTHDRITSPKESAIVAERAEAVAASTSYLPMPGLGHYLISSASEWNRSTKRAVLQIAQLAETIPSDR